MVKPFYTPDEIRSFRTMGLETGVWLILYLFPIQLVKLYVSGVKLLGFKDKNELNFEDNIKHSYFLYPDEMVRILAFCS